MLLRAKTFFLSIVASGAVFFAALPGPGMAFPAFKQSVAEAAMGSEDIAAFYRERDYAPIFTGQEDSARRAALLRALERAPLHGLPAAAYDVDGLRAAFASVTSERDRGRVEVLAARAYLEYAGDVSSGILVPSAIDEGIVREIERAEPMDLLNGFAGAEPHDYLRNLAPTSPQYQRLIRAKLDLERGVQSGGWGATVRAEKLETGDSGGSVVALRNRLISMGYLRRSASQTYDRALESAVIAFQVDHGLEPDGVAGPSTIAAINIPMETRLGQVVVALERERWLPRERGGRHILVNITDFRARILDDGKVTFQTRSVVGKNVYDRRTPEFSDVMEHMVINPTWHVPRSIATKEYLPMLQKNPNAVSHLKLINVRGQTVSRDAVDFTQFTARNFPFDIKQPPSRGNALGLVKFMFPNKHNIYLHDTPHKKLFAREKRDFSHGCIRLRDPFDFAYALLAVQEDAPEDKFHSILKTGRETKVDLVSQVPVHIIYRTAIAPAKGKTQYRNDVYGRDAKLLKALQAKGVVLEGVQG